MAEVTVAPAFAAPVGRGKCEKEDPLSRVGRRRSPRRHGPASGRASGCGQAQGQAPGPPSSESCSGRDMGATSGMGATDTRVCSSRVRANGGRALKWVPRTRAVVVRVSVRAAAVPWNGCHGHGPGCHGHAPLLLACPCRAACGTHATACTDTRRTDARVRGTRVGGVRGTHWRLATACTDTRRTDARVRGTRFARVSR